MQLTLDLLLLTGLSLLGLVGWAVNVLGMPGNWLIVALAGGSYLLMSPLKSAHVALLALGAIVAVVILGELLELAASALGAGRLGASKRATALAVVGSIVGALVGLVAGLVIPIPIIGNVIGGILLGGAGAAGGAVLGERWYGKNRDTSLRVGQAAFGDDCWGRPRCLWHHRLPDLPGGHLELNEKGTFSIPAAADWAGGRRGGSQCLTGGYPPAASPLYSISSAARRDCPARWAARDPVPECYCPDPAGCCWPPCGVATMPQLRISTWSLGP